MNDVLSQPWILQILHNLIFEYTETPERKHQSLLINQNSIILLLEHICSKVFSALKTLCTTFSPSACVCAHKV